MAEIGPKNPLPYWMISDSDYAKIVTLAKDSDVFEQLSLDFMPTSSAYPDYHFAPQGSISLDELEDLDTYMINVRAVGFRLSNQPAITLS